MGVKRLYVLRHGNAEAPALGNDAARNLTELGVQEVLSSAMKFKQKNELINQVFVSPYIRAQQTASHFLDAIQYTGVTTTIDKITPSGKPIDVALWLSNLQVDSVLLITHEPFASQMIDLLADLPLPQDFTMQTATMVSVEGEILATACCQLRWVVNANN
jgi:phosphohistidine phosphatase